MSMCSTIPHLPSSPLCPRCLVSNSTSIDQQTSTGQRDFCFFSPPLPQKKIDSTNSRSLHKQQHSFVLGSNQFTASQNRQLEKNSKCFFFFLVDFLSPPSSPSPETPDLWFRVDPGALLRGVVRVRLTVGGIPLAQVATGDKRQATGDLTTGDCADPFSR